MTSAYIQTEVTAEAVMDAMDEDGAFALEVWEAMAKRLNMGLMADDLSDLVSAMENKSRAKWIFDQFRETFDVIENLHIAAK